MREKKHAFMLHVLKKRDTEKGVKFLFYFHISNPSFPYAFHTISAPCVLRSEIVYHLIVQKNDNTVVTVTSVAAETSSLNQQSGLHLLSQTQSFSVLDKLKC